MGKVKNKWKRKNRKMSGIGKRKWMGKVRRNLRGKAIKECTQKSARNGENVCEFGGNE
jgi:hypothetical protein